MARGSRCLNISGGFWCSFWDVEVIDLFSTEPLLPASDSGCTCMFHSLLLSSLRNGLGWDFSYLSKTGWVTTENIWWPPAHFLPLPVACIPLPISSGGRWLVYSYFLGITAAEMTRWLRSRSTWHNSLFFGRYLWCQRWKKELMNSHNTGVAKTKLPHPQSYVPLPLGDKAPKPEGMHSPGVCQPVHGILLWVQDWCCHKGMSFKTFYSVVGR